MSINLLGIINSWPGANRWEQAVCLQRSADSLKVRAEECWRASEANGNACGLQFGYPSAYRRWIREFGDFPPASPPLSSPPLSALYRIARNPDLKQAFNLAYIQSLKAGAYERQARRQEWQAFGHKLVATSQVVAARMSARLHGKDMSIFRPTLSDLWSAKKPAGRLGM